MFHKAITAPQSVVPTWIICDREEDVSDVWVDYMDTENVDGADVTAFLHSNKYDDGMEFRGIRIVDADGAVTFWDRARCCKYDGLFAALCNVEDAAMQATGYGSDDRHDIRKEEASV